MLHAIRSRLVGLGDAELDALAHRLERRAGLTRAIGGKDARDFIQEAVRRVLSGERSIPPNGPIDDALVRIGQSLVSSERKRREAMPLTDAATRTDDEPPLGAHRLPALHAGIAKVRATLAPDSDARAFVDHLLDAIDARSSIKPGDLARQLGWKSRRAYAAWRMVKTALRRHLEGTNR